MFSSIGTVFMKMLPGHHQDVFCVGFLSTDKVETVTFEDPIRITLSLEKFIADFEFQVRKILSVTCDSLMLNRVTSLRSLLANTPTFKIIDNIRDLLSQRLVQLTSKASDNIPNLSLVLINQVCFSEDVWICLGFKTESYTMARNDLNENQFASSWKDNLKALLNICRVNIESIRKVLTISREELYSNSKVIFKTRNISKQTKKYTI